MAERLLDHNAPPRAFALLDQPCLAEPANDLDEVIGRRREIEEAVARAGRRGDFAERGLQFLIGRRIVERAPNIAAALHQPSHSLRRTAGGEGTDGVARLRAM